MKKSIEWQVNDMGSKKKKVIFLALALSVAVIISFFIIRKKPASIHDLSSLERVKVERRDLRQSIVSSGTVKPQVGARVKVGSRVSGKVERLFVQVGDVVKTGQVVAIIEHNDLDAKLKQAMANLNASKAKLSNILATTPREISKAEASIKEVKARLELAELALHRQKTLLKGKYVPQENVDEAVKEVKVLRAQLASARQQLLFLKSKFTEDQKLARAEIRRAEASLEIAKINRSYATIRAPMAGVVASVSTQEGETVAASLSAPTFITLIDLTRLQVDDFVDETDIGNVRIGQDVEFTVDTFPDRTFHGKVEAIHPMATIQENVVYYDVVIKILDRYEDYLRPEMTANVTIITKILKNVLSIPVEAIVREGDSKFVAVDTGTGGYEKRAVRTGIIDGDMVEIREGLKEGERVILGALKGKRRKRGI